MLEWQRILSPKGKSFLIASSVHFLCTSLCFSYIGIKNQFIERIATILMGELLILSLVYYRAKRQSSVEE